MARSAQGHLKYVPYLRQHIARQVKVHYYKSQIQYQKDNLNTCSHIFFNAAINTSVLLNDVQSRNVEGLQNS